MPQTLNDIPFQKISRNDLLPIIEDNNVDLFCRLIKNYLEVYRVQCALRNQAHRMPETFTNFDILRVYNLILLYNGRMATSGIVNIPKIELCNVISCSERNLNSVLVRLRKILNFIGGQPPFVNQPPTITHDRFSEDYLKLKGFPIWDVFPLNNRYRHFYHKYHLIFENHVFIYQNTPHVVDERYTYEAFCNAYVNAEFVPVINGNTSNICGCIECQTMRREWINSRTREDVLFFVRRDYQIPSEWGQLFNESTISYSFSSQPHLEIPIFFKNTISNMPASVMFALSTN